MWQNKPERLDSRSTSERQRPCALTKKQADPLRPYQEHIIEVENFDYQGSVVYKDGGTERRHQVPN